MLNPRPESARPQAVDTVEKVGLRKRLETMVRSQTVPSSIDS